MAFMISKDQPPFSETEKLNSSNSEVLKPSVTSQLYLKASSSAHHQSLDKDVVLRRIRHHKSMNKVRKTVQAILGSSPPRLVADTTGYEDKWLELGDSFTSP